MWSRPERLPNNEGNARKHQGRCQSRGPFNGVERNDRRTNNQAIVVHSVVGDRRFFRAPLFDPNVCASGEGPSDAANQKLGPGTDCQRDQNAGKNIRRWNHVPVLSGQTVRSRSATKQLEVFRSRLAKVADPHALRPLLFRSSRWRSCPRPFPFRNLMPRSEYGESDGSGGSAACSVLRPRRPDRFSLSTLVTPPNVSKGSVRYVALRT